MNNRIHNCTNPHQGKYKKVLAVCSAGLLRSPTTAHILSAEPYNYNTRAVGLDSSHALIPCDDVHLHWADEIICMDYEQFDRINQKLEKLKIETPIYNLGIGDDYAYRDPNLIKLIAERYDRMVLKKGPASKML